MAERRTSRRAWPTVRRVWALLGTLAAVVFFGWSALAFRANADARAALEGDAQVSVVRQESARSFLPGASARRVGLLFFPGGLVDPVAYAPLARAIAARGFAAVVIDLPRRGAFGGADDVAVDERARLAMANRPDVPRWVVAGHSLGGRVAARFASSGEPRVAALVLIGTSHPRDISLADAAFPVTKVLGSRDCIAEVEKSERNRSKLPASTRWIVIDGANHSQFGSYGFQPGDCFARISRERQQDVTAAAIVEVLRGAETSTR